MEGTRAIVRSSDSADYLDVINVSTPTAPVLLNSIAVDAANGIKGISLSGGKVFVANGTLGVKIYDIQNVTTSVQPVLHSSGYTIGAAADVVTDGNYLYVADSAATLSVTKLFN